MAGSLLGPDGARVRSEDARQFEKLRSRVADTARWGILLSMTTAGQPTAGPVPVRGPIGRQCFLLGLTLPLLAGGNDLFSLFPEGALPVYSLVTNAVCRRPLACR